MAPAETSFPLCFEFPYRDPAVIFSQFSAENGSLFFDSAQVREPCGRYSFIAVDPFHRLRSKNGLITWKEASFHGDPFELLRKESRAFSQTTRTDLPPFQGGIAGYFGYELAQHLENVPMAKEDVLQFPDLILGFYDLVLGFDCLQRRAWIFSSGFPEQNGRLRRARAEQRLQALQQRLTRPAGPGEQPVSSRGRAIARSNFTPAAYEKQVQKVIAYILAGDIFEANLSQSFSADLPPSLSPFDLYRRLRQINPAPFAAYLHFDEAIIASASPERFIQLSAGQVETRPIKGTRPRGKTPEEDQALAAELLASEKDWAENVMIVDLLRNDLSRVCEDHSVKVPQLCSLESYPTVHHLVSVVVGKLCSGQTALDLLKATFPGGSITGAPKLRAMEVIAELEPTQRGPYCGSVAYLGFDGNMDSSIIIRSFCIKDKKVSFQAGGAIVADSSPRQEQEEVLAKAQALLRALGGEHDSTD